ncbi:MAG: tetratricopeptide repeat protein, partial [Candidatus Electrothrix sp. AW1]|nr:tetratricopeptide repeat protein [Candidatus Electrothrix gigas]
ISNSFDHLIRSYVDDSQDNGPEAVRQLLAGKQALIILDGAEEADDLPAVLRCCGGCGVLITSRKRSDAPGSLLEVKRLDELPAAEAFRLYSNTAADETTVQTVCEQLGGWPLALRIAGHYLRSTGESAADYLRWLEKEPLKELGDGEHQEENAALLLRRSVAQVSDDARLALGVAGTLAFAPIAREPVAAVLEDDERRARKALGELVNYGLLEKREERWQITHALVHTYSRTELALNTDALERLAGWYIDFCKIQSKAGLEGYARLDGERAHCLRLMESCLNRGLIGELSHLVGKMDSYLDLQGHWIDYQMAFNMMLTGSRQVGHLHNQGWCLNQLGLICRESGEYKRAFTYFKQCLPIWRKLGKGKEEGQILNNIGWTYDAQGNYKQALLYYKQSLKIRRKFKDQSGEGTTLNNIAVIYTNQGKYKKALKYLKLDIAICRDANDKVGEATTLNSFGLLYFTQNNFTKALQYWEQALAITKEVGYRHGEAQTCFNIGALYARQGNIAKTEEYISHAVQIAEEIDHPELKTYREELALVRTARQGTEEA